MADYTLSAKGTFDGSNFNSGLKKSESALQAFANKCNSVGSRGSSSLSKFVGVASKVAGVLGGIATGAFVKGGIDRALNIEQAQYKLKQLGLDVEAVMASATKSVQGTAHSLDAAATTAASLAASGVQAGDGLTRSLQAVAGMATIAGRDMSSMGLIFGKVAAQGKLQGDELMQFAESGINATDALAKYLGKTQAEVKDLVKNSKIDFQTFSDAMYASFGEAAYGANETFSGAMANVQAALSRLSAKFATPVLNGLKNNFQELIPAIDGTSSALNPLIERWTALVDQLAQKGVSGIKAFTDELSRSNDPLLAFKAASQELFGAEAAQGINSILQAFKEVGSIARDAIQWFLSLDSGTQRFIATAAALGLSFKPIVSGIASVVGGIVGFIAKFSDASKSVMDFGIKANNAFKSFGSTKNDLALAGNTAATTSQKLEKASDSVKKTGASAKVAKANIAPMKAELAALASGAEVADSKFKKVNNNVRTVGSAFAYQSKQIQSYSANTQKLAAHFNAISSGASQAAPKLKAVNNAIESSGRGMKGFSQNAASAGAGIKQIGAASQTASTGMRIASAAAGILKTSIATIAVTATITALTALGTMAAGIFSSWQEHVGNVEKATSGLTSSLNSYYSALSTGSSALSSAASGADKYAASLENVNLKHRDVIAGQAQLSDSINKTFSELGSSHAGLNAELDIIDKLTNKYDEYGNKVQLTTSEQGALIAAVQAVNQACGTNYQVIDAANGKLSASTQTILENARAWEQQAVAQAAAAAKADLIVQQAKNEQNLANAHHEVAVAEENLRLARERGEVFLDGYIKDLDLKKQAEQEAEAAVKSNAEEQEVYNQLIADSYDNYQKSAQGIKEFIQGNEQLTQKLADLNIGLDDASQKFSEWGLSTAEVAQLTPEMLDVMAKNWDGSITDIISACEAAGVEIPDSIRQAMEGAAKATEEGKQQIADTVKSLSEAFSGLGDNESVNKLASSLGGSVDQIAEKLNGLGITAEQVSNMSVDTFKKMAEGFQMPVSELITQFNEAGVAIPEAIQTWVDNSQGALDMFNQAFQNIGGEGGMQAFADNLGLSLDAIGQKLAETGIQIQDATAITKEQIDQLSAAFGATPEKIMEAFTAGGVSISDEVRNMFEGAPEAAYEGAQPTGEAAGEGVNDGMATASTDGTDSYIAGLLATAQGHEGEFTAIGVSLGNSLSTGFAQADMASATAAVSNLVSQISGRNGEFQSIGLSHGNAYSTGFASADMASVNSAVQSAISILSGAAGDFQTEGVNSGGQYADGIGSTTGQSQGAATSLVGAATGALNAGGASAYASGGHLGSQFASGIRSQVGAVAAAASALASAAASFIQHTKPDKGPLSKGEEVFGKHLAQNFASGIDSGRSLVTKASLGLASAVADYIAHTQPKQGPLSQGEWIFGYHTASNFAHGIASGQPEVEQSAEELMNAYIDSMISSYNKRSGEIKEASQLLAKTMWGMVNPTVMSDGWTKPITGNIYESMKILEGAGYTLESFKSKMDSIKPDDDDYKEWIDLNKRLTASYDELAHWNSFYKLKDNVISGIETSEDWDKSLNKLSSRLGRVNFSKTFLDAVAGVEDYQKALSQLADMSDEAIQQMVDSYDDLARAERLQEIDTRSLWINSLKYTQDGVLNSKDWLLDYRSTCLDVKEALYSDRGLSKAFEMAGVSVEGFSFDLQSVNMTMTDFLSGMDSFVSSVTNGFQQMTKYNQTSFADWRRNLQLNMAESQAYAQNLAAVMNKIPESIDSEAFRKAVLEGGFGQWGKVMADMANMSADQIGEAVQLYNEAIVEAQQSAIEQFRAIAPGEEIVTATIEGIMGASNQLNGSTIQCLELAAQAAESTYPQWESTGADLAAGIAVGINKQATSIAAAAAEAVRKAISAARAAGDIHSPSKKTTYLGEMLGKGIGIGWSNMANYIAKQAKSAMDVPINKYQVNPNYAAIDQTPAGGYEMPSWGAAGYTSQAVETNYNYGDVNVTATVRSDADIRRLTRSISQAQTRAGRAEGRS